MQQATCPECRTPVKVRAGKLAVHDGIGPIRCVGSGEPAQVVIDHCSKCGEPAHASESNDDGVCSACLACDHSEWGPACPICNEPAVAICVGESDKPRKFLVVAIDVSALTADEIGGLELALSAQTEGVDDRDDGNNYPEVIAIIRTVEV